jgi:pSer/pThr/pTyr-binding forkhead associated (FHA) protein
MPSGPFRAGPDEAGQGASDPEISVGGYFLRIGPRQIPLSSGETLVGRGEECDVVISGALVSRRHARILFDDGEPSVEDLGSMNGTFVNGA